MVRNRIFIGVAAWLLGAVTATGGSLLAVSQLGHGLVGTTNQQLTASAVNSALAGERNEPFATAQPRLPRSGSRSPAARARHAARPPARHHQVSPPASPSPSTSPAPAPPPGTLLASPGGTVLATCQAAGAYLLSWSPQQDFEAQQVIRGPAPVVSVQFGTPSRSVPMRVACQGGRPVVLPSGGSGGGSDGGPGGDE